jgi:hypothetical protein
VCVVNGSSEVDGRLCDSGGAIEVVDSLVDDSFDVIASFMICERNLYIVTIKYQVTVLGI